MLNSEATAQTADSLYKRLGGYDAVAAAVGDLMPRLRNDPKLWVYWKGKSLDSRRRGDQLLKISCALHSVVRPFTLAPI